MKTLIFFISILFTYYNINAQIFDKDTLLYNGDINSRINIVILSDGYQANELNKFVNDAQHFSDELFTQQPFISYKKYFNVFIIKVPSNQSGASHPGTLLMCQNPRISGYGE
ncbi:MAG: hypothetical protein IPJ74_12275 [Saprospiraceae bacterium]|nr:hypothetical protein [Saprospiraceae bacterium]